MMNRARPVHILTEQSHEEAFAQRYQTMMGWAMRLTNRDREQAEDLVHDAFVQFMISRTELSSIESLDGYLYTMLRNLHVSQVRRLLRLRETAFPLDDILSISETASVRTQLLAAGQKLQTQDDLCRICQYAGLRRHSSKAGSAVILRFFLGYYPNEIAAVTRLSRASVDKLMQRSRAEARSYLKDPNSLVFIGELNKAPEVQIKFGQHPEDLLRQLRESLFATRSGECFTADQIREIYSSDNQEDVNHKTLAHLVCCGICLDEVNGQLGLPLLAEREPEHMVGRDNRDKGGQDGDGPSEGGGTGDDFMDKPRRRLKETLEHRPKELKFSVNGFILGSHAINSDVNRLSIVAKGEEKVGFVEVFSEEEVRMLFCMVEPPPDGPVERLVKASLSDGRSLELFMDFSDAWPNMNLTYCDPEFGVNYAGHREGLSEPEAFATEFSTAETRSRGEDGVGPLFPTLEAQSGWRDWFNPMRLAIASTILLAVLAGIWFVTQPTTEPLVARTVLKQARDAEFALAPTAEKVLHRSYQVEEFANGDLKSRRRVDEWQKQKATARRTYDEQDRMIAGIWTTEDGKRQEFTQGEKLKSVPRGMSVPPAGRGPREGIPSGVEDAGGDSTAEPTVNSFANLVDRHGVTNRVTLVESDATYIFSFEDRKGETEQKGVGERLIAASLTLDRNTYNPISQSIILQIGNEQREYRFSEITVEQKPTAEVSPLIFFPEAELTRGATTVTKPLQIEDLSVPPAIAGGDLPANTNVAPATAALEVEVLERLHNIGADISEQIDVTRTPNGRLVIKGLVETDKRKQEILNALAPLRNNPAVTVKVQTIEEATRELERRKTSAAPPTDVSKVQIEGSSIAVDSDLREYFGKRGGDADEQIRRFAGVAVDHSRSAVYQAGALNRMANRFSATQIAELDPAARGKLLGLLRGYAAKVRRETVALRNHLNPVFGGFDADLGSPPARGGVDAVSADGVVGAARRLFELAEANDRIVRSALRLTNEGASAAEIRSAAFRRSMAQAESLAAAIERAK